MITRSLIPTIDRMMTLNRELDRAMTQAWENGGARFWVPALDVLETPDAYVVHAELPGVDPSQVDIRFERNTLTIAGTKPSAMPNTEKAEYRVYTAERVAGSFERAVRLPEYVDGDRIEATYTNGLLSVVVPKSQAAKPRKIEIGTRPEAAASV